MKWPERFVHDELWLRTRRLLLTGLDAVGLSVGEDAYRTYMGGQVALGRRLLSALGDVLDDSHFGYLNSERFLGAHNRRFSRRLPIILAFGAEYAGSVGAVNGGRIQDERLVCECASWFNLGISIFDNLTDRPELLSPVKSMMDGDRLRSLFESETSVESFRRDLAGRSPDDLSVLGAMIGAFFSALHRLRQSGSNADAWKRLGISLVEAYRSQWTSVARTDTAVLQGPLSGAKSIEPFVIMALLVLMTADSPRVDAVIQLARAVGTVFWRVDDLVDLSTDWHSGQASSLFTLADMAEAQGNGHGLRRFLENGALEAAAECVFEDIKMIATSFEDSDIEARTRLLLWIRMYIIDWTH